jgi:hypothetical protein
LAAVQENHSLIWSTFCWVVDQLGWEFDPSKDSYMSTEGPFLGLIENLGTTPMGIATIKPKPQWLANLVEFMQTTIQANKLTLGEARSLQGKLIHLASACEGRIGRGQVHGFKDFIALNSVVLSKELRANILFHLSLIELRPWRSIRLTNSTERPVVIYTDAACEHSDAGFIVNLCFVLIDGSLKQGGRTNIPQSILDSMAPKQTYISHGEAFAPLFCVYHVGSLIKDRSIIWMIDNMGVLACYTKGSSVVADISCIVHAMLLSSARLRLKSWFEHVDSKANLADGGTRGQHWALGTYLPELNVPPWPANTSKASPDTWLNWLDEHLGTSL